MGSETTSPKSVRRISSGWRAVLYHPYILSTFFDSWGWQSSTWTGQRYPKVDQRYGNVKIISEFTHLNMGIL